MKKIIVSVVGLASILVLSACGKSTSSKDETSRTFKTTAQTNVITVDPNRATDVGSYLAISQVVEGLYKQNNQGKVVPSVATKIVQPTNSGKTYTFNLRHDAKWNDGSRVTASDFVASLRRHVDPKTKSQRAGHLSDIQNYAAVNTGKAAPSKLGVKALGKYKLQIKLSHPVPYYNYLIATQLYPINQRALAKWGSKYGQDSKHAASDGAYEIKNWNSSKDTWNLVKNKDYYDADKVDLNKIHFQVVKTPQTSMRLFQAKDIDETQISGSLVADAKKQFKNETVVSKYGQAAFIPWNNYRKTTRNLNLRRALSYAINRQSLAKNVLKDGSLPAQSVVPEGEVKDASGKDFNAGVEPKLTYNLTKARHYFKLAQEELGKEKISVQLLTADTDAYKAVAEYIQSQAKKVSPDFNLVVRSIPLQQEISDFSNHKFDAGTLGWSTDFPDPIDYLNLAAKAGVINFTKWTNAHYQQLIDQINDTTNQTSEQRVKLQQKAASLLNELQGVTPLYQYASVHLRTKNIKGLDYPLIGYQKYEYASWKK
ncbi:peptide ABC transporter substrate-binding protein [Lentilactobacillus parakefiri]|uniref:Oligopeptide ABC transporter substrate-binding protein n=1 Tax=Lentilactobacillus parakefiri TaxID=152332 RepID=A0A269YHZ4_9LACO|nr:peptide ABC transporter substrate-binding protein [Lentilactobacillus parakefiri]PAK85178.1 oligopeptide ABC transporter substrate-binding protein [Lentilactobacillus parakefiri]